VTFFKNQRQYYIPVVNDKILVGFITPYDIFNYILEKYNSTQ